MIVGSTAFFKDIEGFNSKDIDIVELIDKTNGFNISRQFTFKCKCVFQWKRLSPDNFVNVILERKTPMEI